MSVLDWCIAVGALLSGLGAGVVLTGYLAERRARLRAEADLATERAGRQAAVQQLGQVDVNLALTVADLTAARVDLARVTAQRDGLADQLTPLRETLVKQNTQLEQAQRQLENYARSKGLLYSESMDDQRARQLRAADDVSTGVDYMLQALRILAPEKLAPKKRRRER